jgi:hypothetical protein
MIAESFVLSYSAGRYHLNQSEQRMMIEEALFDPEALNIKL